MDINDNFCSGKNCPIIGWPYLPPSCWPTMTVWLSASGRKGCRPSVCRPHLPTAAARHCHRSSTRARPRSSYSRLPRRAPSAPALHRLPLPTETLSLAHIINSRPFKAACSDREGGEKSKIRITLRPNISKNSKEIKFFLILGNKIYLFI